MMAYYPVLIIPGSVSVLGAMLLLGAALWATIKYSIAVPLGLMAIPIAAVSAWTWWIELPEWVAWAVLVTTVALFVTGMLTDNGYWHYGAMATALFGKTLLGLLPFLWEIVAGEVTIPKWVLVTLVIVTIVCLIGWRSERARNMVRGIPGLFRHTTTTETHTAATP